jgi:hypothetical protein
MMPTCGQLPDAGRTKPATATAYARTCGRRRLPPDARKVDRALEGHLLATVELIGVFER